MEPQHDPGVDPDDDQDMADAEDHDQDEANAVERHAPAGALVPPFARRGRPETRYRMELGNQISEFIVDASIRLAHYRDKKADERLL